MIVKFIVTNKGVIWTSSFEYYTKGNSNSLTYLCLNNGCCNGIVKFSPILLIYLLATYISFNKYK